MAKVLLGVTGSVAAIKTPELFQLLTQAGHRVRVVATRASLYFFDPLEFATLPGSQPPERNKEILIIDEDEWPGSDVGQRYARNDHVLHIELRRWAEVLVLAPLDANSLAKLALGLCDNCLTCVWRAWDRSHQVVLAPAMNTLMWEHPTTGRHLRQLAEDLGVATFSLGSDHLELCAQINAAGGVLRIVPPISKRLACEDEGLGALANLPDIVAAVAG